MQTAKPEPCKGQQRSSSTGISARCAKCSCGECSTADSGLPTGWLPSQGTVDRQQQTAWQAMRESSGQRETAETSPADGTADDAPPWNLTALRWALAFCLGCWLLVACLAFGVRPW